MIESENINRWHCIAECPICGALYTVRGETYPDGETMKIEDHVCESDE